jgi:uncharacterized membrane protein YdbT with pleckstrin-like domain
MGYVEALLAANEQIVLATRRHAVVLFGSALRNLIGAFVALIISILFEVGLADLLARAPLLRVIPFFILLIPVLSFLRDYAAWLSEEYFLTNRRVIHARGIINKHVIDSSLEKVNDVVLAQSLLGRMLGYGDIEILTASEAGINKFATIPRPIEFKTEMLNQKDALGGEEHAGAAADIANTIPQLIAQLDALRRQGVVTEQEFLQKKMELLSRM